MSETENQYKKIFLQESDELLQEYTSNLLVLEKSPQKTEAIHAIFRAAHTLKSMSASMGYAVLADLAHKTEDVLDALRTGKLGVNSDLIDLLLNSGDAMQTMVEAVRQNQEPYMDIQELLARCEQVLKIFQSPSAETQTKEGLLLNTFEKTALARAQKEGFSCYHVVITLDNACVLKSVRAFMVFRNLHDLGEVIKSIPDSQKLEEEKFDLEFGCVFISREESDVIQKKIFEILDIAQVNIQKIAVEDSWENDSVIASAILEKEKTEKKTDTHTIINKMQSVRVDIGRLDKLMNLVEELAICKLRLRESQKAKQDSALLLEQLDRLVDDLQNEVMQARLVPVGQVFDRFPRFVRDLAKQQKKKIQFEIQGTDIELDRTVLDEISDSLIHLIKNSIDHGIESPEERKQKGKSPEAQLVLLARRERSSVFIEVTDDGQGMNLNAIQQTALAKGMVTAEQLTHMSENEVIMLATLPGFSTSEKVTEISGRGVGLDVAKAKAESLGGSLLIETTQGQGTKVSLRLPITTAVVKVLLVETDTRIFAIPLANVSEIIHLSLDRIREIEKHETFLHRDHVVPLMRLDKIFSSTSQQYETVLSSHAATVVIVENNNKKFGLVVHSVKGQQDIVIKQLTREVRGIKGFAGAAILGDGNVALVLDAAGMI